MQPRRNRSGRRSAGEWAALGVAVWLLVGAAALASDEDAPPPGIVGLDQLLILPDSVDLEPETRGGATKAEWRSRFQNARADVAAARAALAKTQAKLEEVAGGTSAWQMGAPGIGTSKVTADAPLDYGLSNEKRRNREELERCERHLKELEIEANLAGVPPEWQGIEPGEAPATPQEAAE